MAEYDADRDRREANLEYRGQRIRGRGRGISIGERGRLHEEYESNLEREFGIANESQSLAKDGGERLRFPQETELPQIETDIFPVRKTVIEPRSLKYASSTTSLSDNSKLFPPARPTHGSRSIMLKINFFPITLPNINIHMYHVDVLDDRLRSDDKTVRQKHVCNSVMNSLIRTFKEDFKGEIAVYDGQALLFTKQVLWDGTRSKEYTVNWLDSENGDRKRTHRVIITHASEVDLSMVQEYISRSTPYRTGSIRQDSFNKCRTAIQACEIILRHQPQSRHVNIMNSFYFKPYDLPHNLGYGCDVWEGYYQSIRPGQWQPFIKLNTAVTAMMKDLNIIDFICDATNANNPREAMRKSRELQKLLCNLKVSTRHQEFKRVYKITNSARKVFGKSPATLTFDIGEGKETTAEKYYAQKYKIKLDYPDLPSIMVGNKNTTAIPLELCWIVEGQHKSGRLTPDQNVIIIKYSARPAFEREKITESITKNELVTNDPLLNHYGIVLSNKMIEVEGRVLETPKISLGNKTFIPKDGTWNLIDATFLTGKSLEKWVIVDFVGVKRDTYDQFIQELQIVGGNSGMIIQDPLDVSAPKIDSRDDEYRKKERVSQELRKVCERNCGLQMIVVFISGRPFPMGNAVMYGHIKRVCDSELGVNSQCIKDRNLFKMNKSTVANICLKMNAKLGGINHVVDMASTSDLFKRPIMVIGANVNHPAPGSDAYTPSIAAMVGSLDAKLAKYASSVRFQKHPRSVFNTTIYGQEFKRKDRLEMIDKFEDMFYELVKTFQQFCRGHFPERIIYYRRGVSEGQFTQVLQWELKSMKRSCVRLQADKAGYDPKITIVSVNKKHNLKMFCGRNDQVGRGGNVPPGTCVDKVVTHPFEFDFYLCSHFAPQGTSIPTHYHVLWDENNFTADSLQTLTYQLCYSYARTTKAISMPPPIYYAHLAAKRAAMTADFKDDDTSSIHSESDLDKWDDMKKKILIDKGLMYWA